MLVTLSEALESLFLSLDDAVRIAKNDGRDGQYKLTKVIDDYALRLPKSLQLELAEAVKDKGYKVASELIKPESDATIALLVFAMATERFRWYEAQSGFSLIEGNGAPHEYKNHAEQLTAQLGNRVLTYYYAAEITFVSSIDVPIQKILSASSAHEADVVQTIMALTYADTYVSSEGAICVTNSAGDTIHTGRLEEITPSEAEAFSSFLGTEIVDGINGAVEHDNFDEDSLREYFTVHNLVGAALIYDHIYSLRNTSEASNM